MNFYDSMLAAGLSASSAAKYRGAIEGVLSQWAIEAGLTPSPLTSITNLRNWVQVDAGLRRLPIFKERDVTGHHMYTASLLAYLAYLVKDQADGVESDIELIVSDPTTTATEKASLVACRIGQGTFRQKLVHHWKGCAVTGFSDPTMLVASHIKPWKDSTNDERLDLWNGLLLTPNLDKAFDKGLITFAVDGSIMLSPRLTEAEKLGIHCQMRVSLLPMHEAYMLHHRTNEFQLK